MTLQNNSLPRPYNNLNRYVTEFSIVDFRALIHSQIRISTGHDEGTPGTGFKEIGRWKLSRCEGTEVAEGAEKRDKQSPFVLKRRKKKAGS